MKHIKFVLLIGCILSGAFVHAQTTITIATGASLTSDHQSGPVYRSSAISAYDFCQFAYLYKPSDLVNLPNGATIQQIAWNKISTANALGGAKLKIYLKNSNTTSYQTATPFGTLITGATLVYDNASFTMPATTGYIPFTLDVPFNYTGGSLEIMVSWDISAVSGDPTTGAFSWAKNTVDSAILGYADAVAITSSLSPTSNSISTITNTRPAIQFTFVDNSTPCTSTLDGGNIIALSDTICMSTNFTLTVSNSTTGVSGLTYQWQSSPDNTNWMNIGLPYNLSITTSLSDSTYYRRIISCGAFSDTSDTKKIIAKKCYCTPTATNCNSSDVITNVTVGTLNHNSTCSTNGYIDYSDSVAAVDIRQAVPTSIKVTVGPGGTEYVGVWIDYNKNGLFDPSEFTYLGSGNGVTISSFLNVPANVPIGLTRMRVRVRYNTLLDSTNSCIGYAYGETEDYSVNILAAIPCNNSITGGTTLANNDSVCIGTSVRLNTINSTTGVTGLSYQWQSSTDNTNWTNIPSATDTILNTTVSASTYFRRGISCGVYTVYSTVKQIKTRLCYCIPSASTCSVNDRIDTVVFGTLNHSSLCSANGYIDYSDSVPPPSVKRNEVVPVKVSVGPGGTEYVGAWIDYNKNGVFDTTEYTYIGTGDGVTISGNISIPVTAPLGITKMRFRVRYNNRVDSTNACSAITYGETEDYKVQILPADCVASHYYWIGGINNDWETPGNWSCNIVPDANAQVFINFGNVQVNSNVNIYSLNLNPSAKLTITPPYNFTVNH